MCARERALRLLSRPPPLSLHPGPAGRALGRSERACEPPPLVPPAGVPLRKRLPSTDVARIVSACQGHVNTHTNPHERDGISKKRGGGLEEKRERGDDAPSGRLREPPGELLLVAAGRLARGCSRPSCSRDRRDGELRRDSGAALPAAHPPLPRCPRACQPGARPGARRRSAGAVLCDPCTAPAAIARGVGRCRPLASARCGLTAFGRATTIGVSVLACGVSQRAARGSVPPIIFFMRIFPGGRSANAGVLYLFLCAGRCAACHRPTSQSSCGYASTIRSRVRPRKRWASAAAVPACLLRSAPCQD